VKITMQISILPPSSSYFSKDNNSH